jgi:hypothetical protein
MQLIFDVNRYFVCMGYILILETQAGKFRMQMLVHVGLQDGRLRIVTAGAGKLYNFYSIFCV